MLPVGVVDHLGIERVRAPGNGDVEVLEEPRRVELHTRAVVEGHPDVDGREVVV